MRVVGLELEHVKAIAANAAETGAGFTAEHFPIDVLVRRADGVTVLDQEENPVAAGGIDKQVRLLWAVLSPTAKPAHLLAFARAIDRLAGTDYVWSVIPENQPQMYKLIRKFGGKLHKVAIAWSGRAYYLMRRGNKE